MSSLPRTRGTGATHPEVLQHVDLRLERTIGEPIQVRAKVLDIEATEQGDVLVVSCPSGTDRRQHHFEATLSWTHPLGRMDCAVTTSPARREYGPVWLVVPHGPTTRVQQREFFRASVSIPVRLSWWEPAVDAEPGEPEAAHVGEPVAETVERRATGAVVDLSEGGLLATLREPLPSTGTRVEATLVLDGGPISAAGTVVRTVTFAGGSVGIAIAFTDPSQHGDRIRRVAFEAERRQRRTT